MQNTKCSYLFSLSLGVIAVLIFAWTAFAQEQKQTELQRTAQTVVTELSKGSVAGLSKLKEKIDSLTTRAERLAFGEALIAEVFPIDGPPRLKGDACYNFSGVAAALDNNPKRKVIEQWHLLRCALGVYDDARTKGVKGKREQLSKLMERLAKIKKELSNIQTVEKPSTDSKEKLPSRGVEAKLVDVIESVGAEAGAVRGVSKQEIGLTDASVKSTQDNTLKTNYCEIIAAVSKSLKNYHPSAGGEVAEEMQSELCGSDQIEALSEDVADLDKSGQNDTRKVCVGPFYFSCQEMLGAGPDQCSNDNDCGHKECDGGFCKSVKGAGPDQCSNENDCVHKACRRGGCYWVTGVGPDQCSNADDCGYRECGEGLCRLVEGAGPDQCSKDSECRHRACDGYICATVPGVGPDKCSNDSECSHRACFSGRCKWFSGVGPDQCSNDNDCSHRACDGITCRRMPGVGPDQCLEDLDCASHRECAGSGYCTVVAGNGEDQCSSDSACGHLECQGLSCVPVLGRGEDQCKGDGDCDPTAFMQCHEGVCERWATKQPEAPSCTSNTDCSHRACQGGACVLVMSAGSHQCTHDSECRHRACIGKSCGLVNGAGKHECSSSAECGDKDPSGKEPALAQLRGMVPAPRLITPSEQITGSPITVEVFQDIKCGMCRYAHQEILPKLRERYGKRLTIVYRQYPLIQREAERKLALGSICAKQQNKEEQYLDYVYANLKEITLEKAEAESKKLGLDSKAFSQCLKSKNALAQLEADIAEGKAKEINGTPTFYINGEKLLGAKPVADFARIIEQ